jgi:cytochrome b561
VRTVYFAGAVLALALLWLCCRYGDATHIYRQTYLERTVVPPTAVLVALHWLSIVASIVLLLISALRLRSLRQPATESKSHELLTYISLSVITLLLVILGGRICISVVVGTVK